MIKSYIREIDCSVHISLYSKSKNKLNLNPKEKSRSAITTTETLKREAR